MHDAISIESFYGINNVLKIKSFTKICSIQQRIFWIFFRCYHLSVMNFPLLLYHLSVLFLLWVYPSNFPFWDLPSCWWYNLSVLHFSPVETDICLFSPLIGLSISSVLSFPLLLMLLCMFWVVTPGWWYYVSVLSFPFLLMISVVCFEFSPLVGLSILSVLSFQVDDNICLFWVFPSCWGFHLSVLNFLLWLVLPVVYFEFFPLVGNTTCLF